MARILTGIQSTGTPHLGNILGAIRPAIELAQDPENESFLFIADMHSLTQIKDGETLRDNTYRTAAAWLAFGVDPERTVFYRQSDVPQVCELTWYLSCHTPFPMLANAHSFKDKSDRLSDVNAGLFTYPVLMASDIILYDADLVPVGKDQVQHLEITRDIANSFNFLHGETFIIPQTKLKDETMYVPGTDGQKMSKSYGNFIDIFQTDKKLRKTVMKIETDATPLEEPKDPDTCNVFAIYKILASQDEADDLASQYRTPGFGYGQAKQILFEKIVEEFEEPRARFEELIADKSKIEEALQVGAEKARVVAVETLQRVRKACGY